jgi:hypothetical protein
MNKLILALLFLSSFAFANEGTASFPQVNLTCSNGVTEITLYAQNANPQAGILQPLQTLSVRADDFSVYDDLANVRLENGKMIWQSVGNDMIGIAVTLSKDQKTAQLTRIESTGTVVKKTFSCSPNQ